MAAPHVSGALGVIMQRYPYMNIAQIRDVMLTTARQHTLRAGLEGKPLERWGEDGLGVPSKVWGWGILDLGKAMFGPGQFMGDFDVTMNGTNDIWTNDISDKAIKFRKTEDAKEAATWAARKAVLKAKANLSAEEQAELKFETAREHARNQRAAQGYEGALIKRGDGTLRLAGTNTFTGATTIKGGKISALNQSIGSSKNIDVQDGGALEVLNSITYKTPSKSGFVTHTKNSDATIVKATIQKGGAFVVNDGAKNLNLTFKSGSILKAATMHEELANLANNPNSKKTLNASGSFTGANLAAVEDSYAFFKTTKELADGSNLCLALQKGKSMEEVAASRNEKAFARLVEVNKGSKIYSSMLGASRAQARGYYEAFSNDLGFSAQNSSVINTFLLANSVKNQSGAKRADIDAGVQLWLLSAASRLTNDKSVGGGRLGTNAFTNLVGIDFLLGDNAKVGTFVGIGRTKHKLGDTIAAKSKDAHAGVYADIGFEPVKFSLGAMYSKFDREARVAKGFDPIAYEYKGADEKMMSAFAEVAYSGLNRDEGFGFEPYAALTYIRANTDDIANSLVGIKNDKRDLQVASVGLRPSVAFKMDGVNLTAKADIAYSRFFGDKAAQAHMHISGLGGTTLQGEKLKDLASLSLGVEAALTARFKLGLSYVGAYGSDIKSNGVNAKFSWSF